MNKKIVWLATLLLLISANFVDAQQTGKIFRIGILDSSTASGSAILWEAFQQELRKFGWIEGKNITIEYRFAEQKPERLPELATDLVRLKVDLIVVTSSVPALAAKKATTTIPIVMTNPADPVGAGLVASLARPGGNVTGLSTLAPDLSGKALELLKETVPKVSRVAVIWNPDNPGKTHSLRETEVAARAFGLQLQPLEVRGPSDIEPAFQAARRERAGGLIVLRDVVTVGQTKRIVELALKNRLPTIYNDRDFVDAGGLMSYGPNMIDLFRRAAAYVDKILKGAKPADLP